MGVPGKSIAPGTDYRWVLENRGVEAGSEFMAAMTGLIVVDYAHPAGYQAGTNPLVDLRLHLGDPVQGGCFNT